MNRLSLDVVITLPNKPGPLRFKVDLPEQQLERYRDAFQATDHDRPAFDVDGWEHHRRVMEARRDLGDCLAAYVRSGILSALASYENGAR